MNRPYTTEDELRQILIDLDAYAETGRMAWQLRNVCEELLEQKYGFILRDLRVLRGEKNPLTAHRSLLRGFTTKSRSTRRRRRKGK